MSRAGRASALVFSAIVFLAGPLGAQAAPPSALAPRNVSFPEFSQTWLPNGIELIVVEHSEQPFVSLNLVVPGGAVVDPPGREGTAEMVVNLLSKGTLNRSGAEVAETIARMGATLEGEVGLDWSTVALEVLSPSLDDALLVMADVVLYPRFSTDEIEQLRNQMLQGLVLAESTPASLASRQFVRTVFGDHPYGRLATEESVRAITRDDLLEYHERFFRANGAIFIVSGDVTAESVRTSLTRLFGQWGGVVPPRVQVDPPDQPVSRRVVLVDLPGARQASLVVGGSFAALGRDEDRWLALEVVTETLGGASSGRLFQALRETHGWTYAVQTEAGRRIGPGLFRVDAVVRGEVLDSALAEVLDQLERVRTEPIAAAELADVKTFLSGSFPLRLETPQQIAAQLLRYRLLGMDLRLPQSYRTRVLAVTAEVVREMAQYAVDPSRAVVVIVGDADRLVDRLEGLGDIEIVSTDGSPLATPAPTQFVGPLPLPTTSISALDPSGLSDGRWDYDVRAGPRLLGRMIREISHANGENGPTVTVTSSMELGQLGFSRQSVTFTVDGFRPVSTSIDRNLGGAASTVALHVEGDLLTGSTTGSDGTSAPFSAPIPEGAVIGEMQEVALWLTDLSETSQISVRVMGQGDGEVRSMRARVVGEMQITVPAGTFDVWEVEFQLDGPPQRAYLTRAAPHLLVRLGSDAAAVTIELRSVEGRKP